MIDLILYITAYLMVGLFVSYLYLVFRKARGHRIDNESALFWSFFWPALFIAGFIIALEFILRKTTEGIDNTIRYLVDKSI